MASVIDSKSELNRPVAFDFDFDFDFDFVFFSASLSSDSVRWRNVRVAGDSGTYSISSAPLLTRISKDSKKWENVVARR
jgi:hypothetical protein